MLLVDGQDLLNCMKQAAQFGLQKKMPIGGGLSELEVLNALPPEARIGWWTLEWYWNQPNVPHVKEWVDRYRKTYPDGSYPSARTWFGYAGLHSLALGAAHAKSIAPTKLAKGLEGLELPPEIKLQPNKVYFRTEDHQLMSSEFPGEINSNGNVSRPVQGGERRSRRQGRAAGDRNRLQARLSRLTHGVAMPARSRSYDDRAADRSFCRRTARLIAQGRYARMQLLLFNAFNGLIQGVFYALMALGLALILSLNSVINMAHGGFLVIGAYLAYYARALSRLLGRARRRPRSAPPSSGSPSSAC